MFSIQKKHKVQALFYNENFKNPKGPEIKEAIDPNHPNGKVYQLLSEIKERAGSIQDHTRTLDAEHLRNLGLNNLVPFFVAHPNFYYDLKRKIHKIHANKETGGRYQIPKEKEEEIFSIFLRFASHNTMSTDAVERVIRDEVFGNRKLLITLSEGSVSLLDTSHGDIQRKIKEGKMTRINCIRFIESVVREGLHINNQDNNKQNIQAILPKITDYLKEYI